MDTGENSSTQGSLSQLTQAITALAESQRDLIEGQKAINQKIQDLESQERETSKGQQVARLEAAKVLEALEALRVRSGIDVAASAIEAAVSDYPDRDYKRALEGLIADVEANPREYDGKNLGIMYRMFLKAQKAKPERSVLLERHRYMRDNPGALQKAAANAIDR